MNYVRVLDLDREAPENIRFRGVLFYQHPNLLKSPAREVQYRQRHLRSDPFVICLNLKGEITLNLSSPKSPGLLFEVARASLDPQKKSEEALLEALQTLEKEALHWYRVVEI